MIDNNGKLEFEENEIKELVILANDMFESMKEDKFEVRDIQYYLKEAFYQGFDSGDNFRLKESA